MLVHRCDRCCVYKKEIQPCRAKYRGIWAILMHKMMFQSESCYSVLHSANSVRFRGHFLPAYPLNHFAYPWGYAYPSLGTDDIMQYSQDSLTESQRFVLRCFASCCIEIGRAHVCTPVTLESRIPSYA